jgi:predicted phosphoribosyltransferase
MSFRGSVEYDKTIVLVDDAISIGVTMLSAVQWAKDKTKLPRATVDRLSR